MGKECVHAKGWAWHADRGFSNGPHRQQQGVEPQDDVFDSSENRSSLSSYTAQRERGRRVVGARFT